MNFESEVLPLFANEDEGALVNAMDLIATATSGQEQIDLLKRLIDSMVAEDTGVLLSRTLLTNFATKTLVRVSDASAICVGEYALERVSHRSVNFDVQVTAISECVANAYERNQEWAKAAAMLKRIALDTTHRHMTVAQRLQMFLRVTSLYLKENDIAMAEDAINRAAMIAPDGTSATKDPAFTTVQPGHSLSLEMLYMELTAEVMDRRSKFIEAAQRYYTLSLKAGEGHSDWTSRCLQRAINCVVLSAASKSRSRLLTLMYKDERCHRRQEHDILRKLYLEQIIRPHELAGVQDGLADHQKQLYHNPNTQNTDSCLTLLQRANIEHNVVATSHIYANMGMQQLGGLLGVDADVAERLAAQMIQEGRLNGCIDQIDNFIEFDTDTHGEQSKAAIQDTCLQVNRILDAVAEAHPQWMAAHNGDSNLNDADMQGVCI